MLIFIAVAWRWWGCAMLAAYVTWPPEASKEVQALIAAKKAELAETESHRRVA
jgi:hypothetical protein